ncbi:MAG: hypothetical protein LUD54_01115 [Oscillospiraceae bacterium]|nr:hypothetical protein [Oscillospiraceae bacterium]
MSNSTSDRITISDGLSSSLGQITCDAQTAYDIYETGTYITLVGKVGYNGSFIASVVNLDDCYVESSGEESREKSETLTEKWVTIGAELAAQAVEDYKAACITVDYHDVERNPSDYDGTNIKFSGSVIQTSETTLLGTTSLILRVSESGNTWYVTYTLPEGASRILEGDYVSVYGECGGVKSYTTVLGSSVTIPCVDAEYIDIG